MGKQKKAAKKTFRQKSDSVTIANKNLEWVKRALAPNPIGVNNPDGTVSSHKLAAETDEKGNWHVFPTLDFIDNQWNDMRVDEGQFPMEAFNSALKNKNTINFGKDGDFAQEYSKNGLINHNKGMKKKKKAGLGIQQYLETPAEALSEDRIAKAKAAAEAESNPWIKGMELIGGMAMDYGMSMAGGASRDETQAIIGSSKGTTPEMGFQAADISELELYHQQRFGAFGINDSGGEIEAEGGEVVDTGNNVTKLTGAKHEQGGQDISIPDGTNIFSDRIFVKGKSIADRKEARTRKQTSIEKLLKKTPSDKLLKTSYDKSLANFEKEEQKDLEVQKMIQFITGSRGEAMFGLNKTYGLTDMMDEMVLAKPEKIKAAFGFNQDSPSTNSFGNILGVAGNLYSGIAPLLNTMRNRASDTPNVNSFKEFGNEALKTIDESKQYVAGQRDNALKDISRTAGANKSTNRNTARGVNTMRALDLATDAQTNQSKENVYDNFAKQMMGILSGEASAEMNIDAKVTQGEAARDLADRQDKDNYATQLGADKSNLGTALQTTGKDLNQAKQQDAINKILSQLSDYGITFDKGYNLQNPE